MLSGEDIKDIRVEALRELLGRFGEEVVGRLPEPKYSIESATKIAQPLPPVPFLLRPLGLAAGAPALVAGYGFAGKTIALQSMALSVASGKGVWGLWTPKRGRAIHIDFEQGRRLTCERYQRLAIGMGVDLHDLDDALGLCCFPKINLEHRDTFDVYRQMLTGYDLAIVDSLRAAAPRADENSSEARVPMDILGRVSEATGCLVVLLHHARKPTQGEGHGSMKYRIRGSGALFDAAASVFTFAAEKGRSTRVSHEKCRNLGQTAEDFGLKIEDTAATSTGMRGLTVSHMDLQQLIREDEVAKAVRCGVKRNKSEYEQGSK